VGTVVLEEFGREYAIEDTREKPLEDGFPYLSRQAFKLWFNSPSHSSPE
jgi:hypothetical protein